MYQTIFELIDQADADGRYRFIVTPLDLRIRAASLPSGELCIRELLAWHLEDLPLYALAVRNNRTWRAKFEVTDARTSEGGYAISVNLAKLLLLPGEAPSEELKALRALHEACKPFFEQHATVGADVRFFNERDQQGRVHGEVRSLVHSSATDTEEDLAHTRSLKALIAVAPALQHHMREVALLLGKLGRWSWYSIREDHLFGTSRGPRAQFLREALQARHA